MHASTMTEDLARQIRRVRKSGFTIAPEAGRSGCGTSSTRT
jgi:hypothetical protein